MAESKRYTLNKADLESLTKGLLITMAGAGLTYLTEYLSKQDFGDLTPVVMTGMAFLVNFVRKFMSGSK